MMPNTSSTMAIHTGINVLLVMASAISAANPAFTNAIATAVTSTAVPGDVRSFTSFGSDLPARISTKSRYTAAHPMPRPVAYMVVFVASCCTLILELVAGRILAPYIGVSLYTWTSIIGVVLAGISLGNYLGGRIADRWPFRSTLGVLLTAGGLASLAILPLINIATGIPTGDLVDPSNRLGGVLSVDRATLLILRIVT